MSKRLILFRHAKSDWESSAVTDHARPLARRGVKAAGIMGRFLRDAGEVPDQVLSSSALRAISTVQLAARAGGWIAPVETSDALYLPETETVLEHIRAVSDTVDTLMLVGHEPTWSELIGELVGGASVRFPTAAMARINFDVDSWEWVRFGDGELAWLVKPRLFAG
jgi:phosphohistidine phosphatase